MKTPAAPGFFFLLRNICVQMISTAKRVHGINKYTDPLRIYIGRNAMAKIKHMPTALAKPIQNHLNFLPDTLWRTKQDSRVHVTLQRNLAAYPGFGISDINSPVQT